MDNGWQDQSDQDVPVDLPGRQEWLDLREVEADRREEEADQREELADQREGEADQREDAADRREEKADRRDHLDSEFAVQLAEFLISLEQALNLEDRPLALSLDVFMERALEGMSTHQGRDARRIAALEKERARLLREVGRERRAQQAAERKSATVRRDRQVDDPAVLSDASLDLHLWLLSHRLVAVADQLAQSEIELAHRHDARARQHTDDASHHDLADQARAAAQRARDIAIEFGKPRPR